MKGKGKTKTKRTLRGTMRKQKTWKVILTSWMMLMIVDVLLVVSVIVLIACSRLVFGVGYCVNT
jgi:hypothetical protein